METVTIATFNKSPEAEVLRRRLAEAGIPAEVQNESTLEWLWFSTTPMVRVRLKVSTSDFEKAIRSLREWEGTEGVLREAIRCPECASSRVEYPQFTRKFFLPNLIGVLAAAGFVERKFYCEDCHFTWPRYGRKRSQVRPHEAPYYFIEGIAKPEIKAKAEG